eukprot:9805595-Ditylum_brightwellii.AAC.1
MDKIPKGLKIINRANINLFDSTKIAGVNDNKIIFDDEDYDSDDYTSDEEDGKDSSKDNSNINKMDKNELADIMTGSPIQSNVDLSNTEEDGIPTIAQIEELTTKPAYDPTYDPTTTEEADAPIEPIQEQEVDNDKEEEEHVFKGRIRLRI